MTCRKLKLNNQLCFKLYTASRLITKAYEPYFRPLGITYTQYLVLMVLWEHDHQPVNDIAKALFLETNTVTPLIQRMEKAGLVERIRGCEDCRQRIVSLTEQGRELERKGRKIPSCMSHLLQEQGLEEDELYAIAPVLDRMICSLSEPQTKDEQSKSE
ncbi:MAG: MarR family transcriptional regulator [Prevotella sp.]|nr:MarR family transcriptional regulator [Prevotella sp.]